MARDRQSSARSPGRDFEAAFPNGFSPKSFSDMGREDQLALALRLFAKFDPSEQDFFRSIHHSMLEKQFTWHTVMATVTKYYGPSPNHLTLAQLVTLLGIDPIVDAHFASWSPLDPGRQAVSDYLWCIEKVLEGASSGEALRGFGTDDWERGQRLSRELWTKLRDARVFEVSHEDMETITIEAGNEWARASGISKDDSPKDYSEADWDAARELAAENLGDLDVSGLPFDWVFIGVSSLPDGWTWDGAHFDARLPKGMDRNKVLRMRFAGYLVGRTGEVFEMLAIHCPGDAPFLLPNLERSVDGEWLNVALLPAKVPMLLSMVEDHRTFTKHKPSFGMRYDFKKRSKATGTRHLPRPYYTIKLDPTRVVRDGYRPDMECPGRSLSHRYDRSGHERCYVRRGPLPLTEKEREKLEGYGYRIYTSQIPSAADAYRLSIREMRAKRSTEWLAIKHRAIGPTVVGDESLPYVPAVRVPQ